jgi:hypothetical protein
VNWKEGDIAKLDYLGWNNPDDGRLVEIVELIQTSRSIARVVPLSGDYYGPPWPISPANLRRLSPLELLALEAK